ncbi:MAG TPA: TIGR03560 family F420-dependent LLM class oxidoreductase [Candidatus Binataceae bacterium]|nr:TIGR03560 family F420-dependent LLM class oxidoreductase [Candidatus Binataceae bacterium]
MAAKVEFGIFSPQAGLNLATLIERCNLAERLGFHSLWLVDHVFSPLYPDLDHHECLALLSALAARTGSIRLGVLVLCNSFRNPALLAKSLTTIDHISGGRLEVGLGAGWAEREYDAYGYEFPSISVRLKQLEESVQIIKAMFSEARPSFNGSYYRIAEATNNPKPLQKPHPPITIGGSGEKVMLRLVAKYADRWNCPSSYRDFNHKLAVLKDHCQAVGRDFNTLQISEQTLVCMGRDEAEAEEKWKAGQKMKPFSNTAVRGTPGQVVDQLRERVDRGVRMFVCYFSDQAAPATLEMFAREVMPAFA